MTTVEVPQPTKIGTFDRNKVLFIAGIVAAVVLCIFVAPKLFYAAAHETTDDAYVDTLRVVVTARTPGMITQVAVHEGQFVHRGDLLARMDDADASATVEKAEAALISAEGQLAQARSDAAVARAQYSAGTERAHAAASQAMAEGRSYDLQAEANVRTAQAANAQITEDRADLASTQAALPAAREHQQIAHRNLQRYIVLSQQGYVSQTDLETAQNTASAADAAYRAAQSDVSKASAAIISAQANERSQYSNADQSRAEAQSQYRGADVADADLTANSPDVVASKDAIVKTSAAAVREAQQSLMLAKHALTETTIVSPVEGYVGQRVASVGQTLAIGDPAVVVMPMADMYVTANFKETQVGRMQAGQDADVHIDAFPWIRFHGHVESVGAASQSDLSIAPNTQVSTNFVKVTQRVPIRIHIDEASDSDHQPLRPGMSAEVSVQKH